MKKILSMLAVAAMAFTACTTDITEDVVKDKVNAGYTFEFTVDQEVSRAFMDDDVTIKFEEGDVFGVYINPADGNTAATKNAKGTLGANGVVTVTGLPAEVVAGDKLMAYYPWDKLNNDREATDIILTMQHVQMQNAADKVNLKHMPMVSETTIAEATDNSLYFRPVAAIIKFNIYSSDEDFQNAVISGVRFAAEKHENVTACNYVSGNRSGFDLTNISHDGEIAVKKETFTNSSDKLQWTVTSTPSALQVAYRVNVNCANDTARVGTDGSDATPVYVCVWPGNYGGPKFDNEENLSFVQVFTEKGFFKINMNENYEFGRAMIRPFSVGLVKDANFRVSVGLQYVYEHAHVAGIATDQMLTDELIVIASGNEAKCNNIFPHKKLTDYNTFANNDHVRAAYVQTLDGSYGARLEYFTAGNNTLKRGDKIKICLNGTKQYNNAKASGDKEATSDVHCVRIIHFAPENILSLTPGCENEIVAKEKTLAELTDQDIYTEVTLKDMEVVVKQTSEAGTPNLPAPYTYGYEAVKMAIYTSMLQDKDNNAIFALFNQDCGNWRRNVGVPQGVGSVRGVIVNETSNVTGDMSGNMGRYQVRPLDETAFSGISETAEDATTVLAKWSLLRGHVSVNKDYKFTCEDEGCLGTKNATTGYQQGSTNADDPLYSQGLIPQNKMWATHGQLTDGRALFYSTNRALINRKTYFYYGINSTTQLPTILNVNVVNSGYPVGIFHGLKRKVAAGGSGDINSVSSYTSLVFHSSTKDFYKWNGTSWTNETTGFVIELPTTGADKQLAVSFSMAPASAYGDSATAVLSNKIRHNVLGYPVHWKVECSTDGGNTWTACQNAITQDENGAFDLMTPNLYIHNTKYLKPTNAAASATWDAANAELVYAKTPSGSMSAGYCQYKFLLPESAQNQAKVMIKISPRDLTLAWPSSNAWGATFDSGNELATSTMTQGCVIAFEDVAVTCAK